jgi:hypothetical protein
VAILGTSANCTSAGRAHDQGDAVTGDIALDSEQIIRRAYKIAEDKDIARGDPSAARRVGLDDRRLSRGRQQPSRDPDGMLAEFVEVSGGKA